LALPEQQPEQPEAQEYALHLEEVVQVE